MRSGSWRTELRGRTTAILDAAAERGECDFLVDVAAELPLQAIAQLMGVPQADRHELFRWADATLDYDDRELGQPSEKTQSASANMQAYGMELVAEKRRAPGDDILSAVVGARIDGADGADEPLADIELLMFFNLLIAAGSETTRNSIAVGVATLAEQPDQWRALRDDRTLLPSAVEEILRWASSTPYNRRTATRETEIGGQAIAAGDKVTLWWASANRDETVFDEPFRFDVRRDPNPHLTFGHGAHFCLGANLARLEMRLMLDALLDRFDAIDADGSDRVDPQQQAHRRPPHAGPARPPLTAELLRAAALVQGDRSLHQCLEGAGVELRALVEVDRPPGVPVEARVEQPGRVGERGAPGERELDLVLVGLTGADDPGVRPRRDPRARRLGPLPLLDDVGVGRLDELAHPAQDLAAPVAELGDAFVDPGGVRHRQSRAAAATGTPGRSSIRCERDAGPLGGVGVDDDLVHDLAVARVTRGTHARWGSSMRNIVEHGHTSGSSDTTVLSGCSSRHALHHVDLGADAEHRARRRCLDPLEDALGRADLVGELDDLVRALGVHDDLAVGVLGPERGDVLGRKRWCTEQWPFHSRNVASFTSRSSRPPSSRRGFHTRMSASP